MAWQCRREKKWGRMEYFSFRSFHSFRSLCTEEFIQLKVKKRLMDDGSKAVFQKSEKCMAEIWQDYEHKCVTLSSIEHFCTSSIRLPFLRMCNVDGSIVECKDPNSKIMEDFWGIWKWSILANAFDFVTGIFWWQINKATFLNEYMAFPL